jgi:hypothetical protein
MSVKPDHPPSLLRPNGRQEHASARCDHRLARLDWVASLLRTARSAPAGVGCVLWVDPDGSVRMRVLERPLTLGRDPFCDLVLPQPGVDYRHCRIAQTAAGASICDLGSATGTWLNGRRVGREHHPLSDGDVIELGGVLLAFVG